MTDPTPQFPGLFFFSFPYNWLFLRYNSPPLKCTVWWVLVYSQGCTTITTTQIQNSVITPKRNTLPLSSHSPFSPYPAPAPTTLSQDVPVYVNGITEGAFVSGSFHLT